MADPVAGASGTDDQVQRIQRMLTRERLAVDIFDSNRTTFLTHIGAQSRLVPGPWIAHRELVHALALANLSPSQRSSLARAIVVEWGREFGVGRLVLHAVASGLPLGGASLSMRPRAAKAEAMRCLYTWALSARATPVECDWLLLRAQPEWALDRPVQQLGARGLETLAELGGKVLLLVPSAVAARQVADVVAGKITLSAHPRFTPYLEGHETEGELLLWPHDAIMAPSLARHEISTAVLIGAPEDVRQEAARWAVERPGLELVDAACPGRVDRKGLARFWHACGRPKILLRGDPGWTRDGAAWLRSISATVAAHSEGTQLGLFAGA